MMEIGVLNHIWLKKQINIVKHPLDFFSNSINGILITNVAKERTKVKENKEKVLDFIKENKKVYLSEISEKFNLDLVETKQIINELEKESKIKINE